MDKLNELIEIFKDRAKNYKIEAEVAKYLDSSQVEELAFFADESELIAILLENYNMMLDYDEIIMSYEADLIKAKQVTKINIPFDNSRSMIKIYDKSSKDEIDHIKLKRPLTREDFIVFVKQYEKCL